MGAWTEIISPSGTATPLPKCDSASGTPKSARLPNPAAMEAAAPPLALRLLTRCATRAVTIQVTASPPKNAVNRAQGAESCAAMVATVRNKNAGIATLNTNSDMPLAELASTMRNLAKTKPKTIMPKTGRTVLRMFSNL